MIEAPLRATWKRYVNLRRSHNSILRTLEYERISGLTLKGRTLDIGGGRRNSYYSVLNIEGPIESVNIDPAIEPTYFADLNRPLPLDSEVYDNVISFNTFEHIRNDELAIREMLRVLKLGGGYHIMVPFLFRVHGSPCDYHRHTAHWWHDFLHEAVPNLRKCAIEPILWDPTSTAQSLIDFDSTWSLGNHRLGRVVGRALRRVNKSVVLLRAVVAHRHWAGQERVPASLADTYSNFALGYYIHGKK